MREYQSDVLKFRAALDLPVGDVNNPSFSGNDAEDTLMCAVVAEEVGETVRAIDRRDVLETIDGLCDTLYTAIGAAVHVGIDMTTMVHSLPDSRDISIKDRVMFTRASFLSDMLLAAGRGLCEAMDRRDLRAMTPALAGLVGAVGHIASVWGIPLLPFWNEVQRANMAKVGRGPDGKGKARKPPGWKGPDHLSILARMFGLEVAT